MQKRDVEMLREDLQEGVRLAVARHRRQRRRAALIPLGVELRRWPRKNDADSIRARQDAVRGLTEDGEVLWDELSAWENANEAPTGVAVIPVSVIGPVPISLGQYELREPDGAVVENGREAEDVYVPLAHTEGGLSASLYRGAGQPRSRVASGRTRLAGPDHPRKLLRLQVGGRRGRAAGWLEAELPALQEWLARRTTLAVEARAAARGEDARRRPDVPRALALDDGRRRRGEHDDAQLLRAEHGLHARARARADRAVAARGEHGRRQETVVRVLPERPRQDGDRGVHVDGRRGATRAAHDDRRPARARGWDARRRRFGHAVGRVHAASAIAAIFTATGQDIGMVGTSSMAHGVGRRVADGLNVSIRLPASRWRPSAAAPPSPTRARGCG